MRYVVSALVENDNSERLRAFPDEPRARRYVERLAARLARLCVGFEAQPFLQSATVYEITPSGRMRAVAEFWGDDPRDDDSWRGWIGEG